MGGLYFFSKLDVLVLGLGFCCCGLVCRLLCRFEMIGMVKLFILDWSWDC